MRSLTFVAMLTVWLLAVPAAAPLSARTTQGVPDAQAEPVHREPFDGMIYGCSSTGPDEPFVTPGGVLHFKGGSNVNLWLTNHPLVNGVERNIVDANINFNAGVGRAHAIGTITPEDMAGSWDIRFLVRIPGGGASGWGRGRGALEGLRLDFTVEPVPGDANQCTPGFPFVARVHGTVRGHW